MPPYGRGGAGNIEAMQLESKPVLSEDIEAQQSNANLYLQGQRVEPSQTRGYAHHGRGGMGNYYDPKELAQTGVLTNTERSNTSREGTFEPTYDTSRDPSRPHSISKSTASPNVSVMRPVGRGGAGNYEFGQAEDKSSAASRRLEEQEKQQQIKTSVEDGVKEQLAFPQKAKITGSDPY